MRETSQSIFDISGFIDGRRLSAFNYKLIILSWLITFFDGLDMMMISYTAPYMAEGLELSQGMLGNVFSAGILGMTLGGFGFAYLGDRIGRRISIVIAAFSFGILTFITGFAQTYEQLLLFRFLDGLAIGGMLPLAWALNIEFVPKRIRATVVTLIMVGYSLGTTFAGPLTNWAAPHFGWQGVYFLAGAGTLVCAAALFFNLPESIRFLAARGGNPEEIARLVKRLDPDAVVGAETQFILSDEPEYKKQFRASQLFEGRLLVLTPLIWLGYTASTLTVYLHASWGPIILENLDVGRQTAAWVSSAAALAGAVAGMTLMRFTDRIGPFAIAAFPVASLPVLFVMGVMPIPTTLFLVINVLVVALISGGHYGILSIASIYYPTAIRANGGGWASSVAKMGGVAGPILGGVFLSSGLPVIKIFLFLMLGPSLLALSVIGVGAVVRGMRRKEEEAYGAANA
ncbi:MFS transporter [Marinicaulis flavus]|uniref:MFS transporter n=2 Tax=Hyphococcus luteus TaxID=2058213 RepID=A0A2S7K3X4_9PROT|nr:MFS transporter [Marinicaulis flavus]